MIPANIAEEVADDAAEQDLFETFVTERVREGQSIFGLYPPDAANKQAYEAWRAQAQIGSRLTASLPTRRRRDRKLIFIPCS